MNDPDRSEDVVGPRLRTMQIIALALLMGLIIFLGMVVVLVQQRGGGPQNPGVEPIISYMAFGFFVLMVLLWSFLPARAAQIQVRKIAAGTWKPLQGMPATANPLAFALLTILQTKDIIGRAMLEGPAFFGCIAYLTEAQPVVLAVPGGALLLMLLTFPSRLRVELWLSQQQAVVDEIRQTGGLAGTR